MTSHPGSAALTWPTEADLWRQGAARHRPSHLGALRWVTPVQPFAFCDGIVVPTSRDATRGVGSGIVLAAHLSTEHRCPLIVITSRHADTVGSRAAIEGAVTAESEGRVSPEIVALDVLEPKLPRVHEVDALTEAARFTVGWDEGAEPASDVAHKRNAALALARLRGWQRLLFLDDDIRPWGPPRPGRQSRTLDVAGLTTAMRALGPNGHRAVGWAARDYADNSVVCRVRRWLGEPQGVFVGGGALAVSLGALTPFFPSVYNEDWLFLLALVTGQGTRAVARAGVVRQDTPGKPVDVARARREEFGDVLGEGLMNFLQRPELVFTVGLDAAYWRAALSRRLEMLEELSDRLERAPGLPLGTSREAARELLSGVRELHGSAPPDLADRFCGYVRQWQKGLASWRDLMVSPDYWRETITDYDAPDWTTSDRLLVASA